MTWLLLLPQLLAAPCSFSTPPSVGEQVTIVWTKPNDQPDAGRVVRAMARPGLPSAQEDAIGLTDGFGQVLWTPSTGGPTRLITDNGSRCSVTVAWGLPPAVALIPLLWLVLTAIVVGFLQRRVR